MYHLTTLKQTLSIYKMFNISKSKGDQTMKFGQLIEYNTRDILPEKSNTRCQGEAIPTLF